MIRTFKFWLTVLAIIVCVLNITGVDDKNILLFLTSPPMALMETQWFVKYVIHPGDVPIWLIYILTIGFWFMVGVLLDLFIKNLFKGHSKGRSF